LKAATRDTRAKEKQELRREFHRQLSILWSQPPLSEHRDTFVGHRGMYSALVGRQVDRFWCMPLVAEPLGNVAELDILFLRPQLPGAIVSSGGDLDNRLKTLMDGLRAPKVGELAPDEQPQPDEEPFFCLLEDDVLATRLSVTADQLLVPAASPAEVVLVIHVSIKETGRGMFSPFPSP
jgi:hypothetical protein